MYLSPESQSPNEMIYVKEFCKPQCAIWISGVITTLVFGLQWELVMLISI